MSRFAAVPTAALDDERLEALHIRVLTSLCSYADKDGWCRVGQELIAKRARTNKARVSQCLGDLAGWGWVQKQRVGKKKVNVYQVILDHEYDASIALEDDECVAETANHMSCSVSKSELPREQITVAETANPLRTPYSNTVPNTVSSRAKPKRKTTPKVKKHPIPEDWMPTAEQIQHVIDKGLTREEATHEIDRFRNHYLDRPSIERPGWHRSYYNWCTGPYGPLARRKQPSACPNRPASIGDVFDQVLDQPEYGSQPGFQGQELYPASAQVSHSAGAGEATLFDADGSELAWNGEPSDRAA